MPVIVAGLGVQILRARERSRLCPRVHRQHRRIQPGPDGNALPYVIDRQVAVDHIGSTEDVHGSVAAEVKGTLGRGSNICKVLPEGGCFNSSPHKTRVADMWNVNG